MALGDYFILQCHTEKQYERIKLKEAEINICFLFVNLASSQQKCLAARYYTLLCNLFDVCHCDSSISLILFKHQPHADVCH